MKIIDFIQRVIFNTTTIPDAMDLAIQRVTQQRSQIILFRTDYLE